MKNLYLERWKIYQYNNGKDKKECGFEDVEVFWCSYMQVGILGIK